MDRYCIHKYIALDGALRATIILHRIKKLCKYLWVECFVMYGMSVIDYGTFLNYVQVFFASNRANRVVDVEGGVVPRSQRTNSPTTPLLL